MGLLTRWLLTLSILLFPFFPIRTAAADTPWQWPLEPRPDVLRGFDPPEQRWLAGHLGADLAAEIGQTVLAPADGVVHFAGTVAGVPLVSVAHGDLRSTFLPVRASVARGDPVEAGDGLGTVVAEPAHCAARPCLHFGLLRGSAYLDPLGPLGHGPVRLLPLPGPRGGPVGPEGPPGPVLRAHAPSVSVRRRRCHTHRGERSRTVCRPPPASPSRPATNNPGRTPCLTRSPRSPDSSMTTRTSGSGSPSRAAWYSPWPVASPSSNC